MVLIFKANGRGNRDKYFSATEKSGMDVVTNLVAVGDYTPFG